MFATHLWGMSENESVVLLAADDIGPVEPVWPVPLLDQDDVWMNGLRISAMSRELVTLIVESAEEDARRLMDAYFDALKEQYGCECSCAYMGAGQTEWHRSDDALRWLHSTRLVARLDAILAGGDPGPAVTETWEWLC